MAELNDDNKPLILLLCVLFLLFLMKLRSTLRVFTLYTMRRFQNSIASAQTNVCFLLASLLVSQNLKAGRSVWELPIPQMWFEEMDSANSLYTDKDWREHFRMSRDTFDFICDLLRDELTKEDTSFRDAVPLRKRVATGIWRLANGSAFRITGLQFGLGKSTSIDICHEFVDALVRRKYDFIKFPSTEEEVLRTIGTFSQLSDFPMVVGAIDGSHIPIVAPDVEDHQEDFFNRKHFYSINTQGIVDGNGMFLDICTGFPGSLHDSRMFRLSSIRNRIEQDHILDFPIREIGGISIGPVLVADSAYPLSRYTMTPYRNTGRLTPEQKQYNKTLSRTRVVIEQAFGKLKMRWRCLNICSQEKIDRIPKTILACAILHNIS